MAGTLSVAVSFCLVIAARAVTLRADAGKNLLTSDMHQQTDACACLPWKTVYNNRSGWGDINVTCGEGFEFAAWGEKQTLQQNAYQVSLQRGTTPIFVETCNLTYMQLPYTTCFNADFSTAPKQWCYVSKKCMAPEVKLVKLREELSVNVKMCNASAGDELMSHKTPEEIAFMASTRPASSRFGPLVFDKLMGNHSINQNFLAQISYPHAVSKFSETGACGQPKSLAAAQELEDVMASNVTTYFAFSDVHADGVVVMGQDFWVPAQGETVLVDQYHPKLPNPIRMYKKTAACDIIAGYKFHLANKVGDETEMVWDREAALREWAEFQ